MESSIHRTLWGAALCVPVLLAGAGCADSESVIFIRQAQDRVPGDCTVTNSAATLVDLRGTLDLAFQTQYIATLLVGNQMVPRGNSSQLRTETSRVELQGTIVRAEDVRGAVAWGPVTVPGAGFINPASGAEPSFGLIDTVLLGSELGIAVAEQLKNDTTLVRHFTSVVRAFGRTLGGASVESGEWRFPVDVCYGCLVAFPPDATDPRVMPIPNCQLASSTGSSIERPCIVGQDNKIDCRVCKETYPTPDPLCEP